MQRTLRLNFGSYPVVDKVYAYDAAYHLALVKVRHRDGTLGVTQVTETELQVIDGDGKYHPVREELLSRCPEADIINLD